MLFLISVNLLRLFAKWKKATSTMADFISITIAINGVRMAAEPNPVMVDIMAAAKAIISINPKSIKNPPIPPLPKGGKGGFSCFVVVASHEGFLTLFFASKSVN